MPAAATSSTGSSQQAGTYYLAMDSAGDLPTYRVRHFLASPPPARRPARRDPATPRRRPTTGRPAASLSVTRRQRGDAVRGRIAVRRALLRLTVSVRRSDGTTFASLRLSAGACRAAHVHAAPVPGGPACARAPRPAAADRADDRGPAERAAAISVARPVTLVAAPAR